MSTLGERLEGLVVKWRKLADEVDDKSGVTMSSDAARHFRWCADELAAALVAEGQGAPATNRITLDECFGDPFIWCEGMDHSEALQGNDWILIKAPALRALAAAPSLHKEGEPGFITKGLSSDTEGNIQEYSLHVGSDPQPAALHKEGAGSDELCECGQPENSIRHSFTAASSVDAHAFKPSKLRYCGRCNQRRYFVDGKCEMCAASPAGRAEQEQK